MRENRSGPRSGKPLSRYIWVARKGALERSYEGTVNELILTFFQTPAKPAEVMDELVEKFLANFKPPKGAASPRAYVSQRLYELKRREMFSIRGVK